MSRLILLHASQHLSPIHSRLFTTVIGTAAKPRLLHSRRALTFSPSSSSLRRCLSVRAFDDTSSTESKLNDADSVAEYVKLTTTEDYPSGEFQFREASLWKSVVVKLRMLFAFPWERVKKGSVLTMTLRGQITDQLKSRFSRGLSLSQICENFVKAAYDPWISGVYLQIESLNCGWGKVEEIRRHILDFQKSGKFVVAYAHACSKKEYYLASACQEIYAPPSAYFSLFGLSVQASFIDSSTFLKPDSQRHLRFKELMIMVDTCQAATLFFSVAEYSWVLSILNGNSIK